MRPTKEQACSRCHGAGNVFSSISTFSSMDVHPCVVCNATGKVIAPISDSEMIDLIWERLNNLASSPCPCRSGEVASNPPAIAADGAGKEGE